jgi:hypothetical protein
MKEKRRVKKKQESTKTAIKNSKNFLVHDDIQSTNSPHDKTGFYLKRGSDILIRHALESGLFPLSQHPINTNRVRVVPLVLNP